MWYKKFWGERKFFQRRREKFLRSVERHSSIFGVYYRNRCKEKEPTMNASPGENKGDFADRMRAYREQLEEYYRQQADFEERLERLRQRQHALEVDMKAIRTARKWRIQHQQAFEQERQAWREIHRFFTPPVDK
jgi:chromosome segregation ATPase